MRNKLVKIFPFLLVFSLSFFIFSYKLASSYSFDSDFARDLTDIFVLIQGHLTLLGPKSSFGGLFTGPFYYYLFTPVLFLSKLNPNGVLYFNSFLFALSICYYWFTLTKNFGRLKASLATLSLLLLPVILFSARHPGNAYSYLPLLIFFLTYLTFNRLQNIHELTLIGLIGGILVTTHYSNVVIVAIGLIYIFYFLNQKRRIWFFVLGVLLPFAPLALFEVKHNFVMLKNTFVDKSFSAFTNNTNLPPSSGSSSNFLSIPALGYVFAGGLSLIWSQDKKLKVLLVFSIISLSALALIFTRFQYVEFYLYPVSILLYLTVVFLILKTRYWPVLITLVVFQLITFPKNLYAPSNRPAAKFARAANFVVQHQLVAPNTSFNVLQIRPDVAITPYGFEYRYFLATAGFIPKGISEYNASDTLILFSEVSNLNLDRLSSWEIDQFGKQNLQNFQRFTFEDLIIYRVSKN